jgi:NADH-quinone oxidoreductase subunit A
MPWALLIYFLAALLVIVVMIGLSALLGERRREPDTDVPYESGAPLTGTARRPLSAQYYLVAIVFVIFDLEAVFLFAWAVALRDLGWSGWLGMLVFVAILVVGLIYEWRGGALDWGSAWPRHMQGEEGGRP